DAWHRRERRRGARDRRARPCRPEPGPAARDGRSNRRGPCPCSAPKEGGDRRSQRLARGCLLDGCPVSRPQVRVRSSVTNLGGEPPRWRSIMATRRQEGKENKGAMSVQEAGRKGGETVLQQRGPEFFSEIGKKG